MTDAVDPRSTAVARLERAEVVLAAARWLDDTVELQHAWLPAGVVVRQRGPGRDELLLADADGARPVADHRELAAALAGAGVVGTTPTRLGLAPLAWEAPARALRLDGHGRRWLLDVTTGRLASDDRWTAHAAVSPDGRWALERHGSDLVALDASGGEVLCLPGEPGWGWADADIEGAQHVAPAIWSHDGDRVVVERTDRRASPRYPVLASARHSAPDLVPRLHHVRQSTPETPDRLELAVLHLPTGGMVELTADDLWGLRSPVENGALWWAQDDAAVYLVAEAPGFDRLRLWRFEAATGESRLLHEEHSETMLMAAGDRQPPAFAVDEAAGVKIIYTDRTGWGHLETGPVAAGAATRAVTQGEWQVRRLLHLDARAGRVLCTAAGRREDPYEVEALEVDLATGADRSLTPGRGSHDVHCSPDGALLLVRGAPLDGAFRTALLTSHGDVIAQLPEVGLDAMDRLGVVRPRRVPVVARDGSTPLVATVFVPSTHGAGRLPVLFHHYGNPAHAIAPVGLNGWDVAVLQATAELGLVVVVLDGLGTPGRSKAFHDASRGLGVLDGGGIADLVAALPQLRDALAGEVALDIGRVGIQGSSGGGQNAVRAMLERPEVFSVGIATAGCHDLRANFGPNARRYIGSPEREAEAYVRQATARDAHRLEGRLLLIHGESDTEVLPVATLQLAEALVDAGKDVDVMYVPGAGHDVDDRPPVRRRRWHFLLEHLVGLRPPLHRPHPEARPPG